MTSEKSMVDTFNETLNNLKNTIDSKIGNIQTKRDEFNKKVEIELGDVNDRIKNINGRLTKILSTISDLQNEQKTNSESIATMTNDITTIQSENDKLQKEKMEAESKIVELEKEAVQLQDDKVKFENESKSLNEAIEALKASKDSEKDQKIKELQEQHQKAVDEMNGNIEEKNKEIAQLKQSDIELNAKITDLESKIQELEKEIASKTDANKDIETVLDSAIEKVKGIIDTINSIPDVNDFNQISPLIEAIKESLTQTEALLTGFEDRGKGEVQKAAEKIESKIKSQIQENNATQNISRTDRQSDRPPLPPLNMNVKQVVNKNQSTENDDVGKLVNLEPFSARKSDSTTWKNVSDAAKYKKSLIFEDTSVQVKNKDNTYSDGVVEKVLNEDSENPTYIVQLDDDNSKREVSLSDIELPDINERPRFGGAKKKSKKKSKNKTMKKKKKVTKKKLAIKKNKKYTQKNIK